LTGSPIYVEEN